MTASASRHSPTFEVFRVFLRLGLTSFGGPIAHIGYFRAEFVDRRGWLDAQRFADLLALCQFLPGPASSQLGLAIGLTRAGWMGALAAWLGFTLPSAIVLMLLATGLGSLGGDAVAGLLHGLKIEAVAVVAQAVWSMARTLCRTAVTVAIAVLAAALVLIIGTASMQFAAILLGAVAGLLLIREDAPMATLPLGHPVSRGAGLLLLGVFALLLIGLPLLAAATATPFLGAVADVYRSGALVFGGGHVVLPLLQSALVDPGWISLQDFLAGYGAAQAVPGPLFTVAAYLGVALDIPPGGWVAGTALLLAIFTPGALLVLGALPFWDTLRTQPSARRALSGVNAAVVGLLAAALADPVWTGAIHTGADLALAVAAFVLLVIGRAPPAMVVALCAAGGGLLQRMA